MRFFEQRWVRRGLIGALSIIGIGTFASIGLMLHVQLSSVPYIRSIEELQLHPDAVMILGAGIEDNGEPSDALTDRLIVGERVSRAVEAPMLLTGDGGRFRRDEVTVMNAWLIAHGASPDRMVIDDEGFRTYESCKRAAQVYKLKKIVIVTQRFHLGRAIYLCRSFGLDAVGVPSNLRPYKKDLWFVVRDMVSSVKAWIDVVLFAPQSPVRTKEL